MNYPNIKKDKITPRVVLRYAIDGHSSVYASYSMGYKSPIIDVIGALVGAPTGAVRPESMDAFEVGVKHASNGFSFNLAGFYYDYKDLQVSLYPYGLSSVKNAATARIYGVEGDVRYDVTPDFDVSVGAAYVDAKYKSFPNMTRFSICDHPDVSDPLLNCLVANGDFAGGWSANVPYDASGKQMQQAPKLTATLSARYGLDLAGGRLSLSGNLYHTSSFYYDPAQQFQANGYELLGLRAEWTDPSNRYTVAVYGDNVTGTKYFSQIGVHSPAPGAAWGAPATWAVSLRAKF